ncbi:MAG: DUF2330 domain-containing protein [Chloroflexi bacterium]|nr:DUF2330 domain-containing protein [Chloroflexota bacterium]
MTRMISFAAVMALAISVFAVLAVAESAVACGGFFCQNSPVDQNAERIIFTQNKDGTTSAYIQIQYTGSASSFSWILPLPEAIGPEDIEVPEDAMAAFTELEVATDPVFIPPELPECARVQMSVMAVAQSAAQEDGVEIFASGEVGPYGFDVIGSANPDALVEWLRENEYWVTEEMEPLINVYVEEQFVFLAMRLLPGQGAQDVQPVKITYPSERPMIPLRLTAVAANPDMAVMTWFYADSQAAPMNYAKMEIADEDLTLSLFGRSNYRQLMSDRADEFGGHAFITEYAAPTQELRVTHPLLRDLGNRYPYVTRLNTVISPLEMTVDPVFDYDPQLKDVSNIHDLSAMTGLFDCERSSGINTSASQTKVTDDCQDPSASDSQSVSLTLGVSDVSGTFDEIMELMADLGGVLGRSSLSVQTGEDSGFLSFSVDRNELQSALESIEGQGKVQLKELRESLAPLDGEDRSPDGTNARIDVSLIEDTSSKTGLIVAIAAPSAVAFIVLLAGLFFLTYRLGSRRVRN